MCDRLRVSMEKEMDLELWESGLLNCWVAWAEHTVCCDSVLNIIHSKPKTGCAGLKWSRGMADGCPKVHVKGCVDGWAVSGSLGCSNGCVEGWLEGLEEGCTAGDGRGRAGCAGWSIRVNFLLDRVQTLHYMLLWLSAAVLCKCSLFVCRFRRFQASCLSSVYPTEADWACSPMRCASPMRRSSRSSRAPTSRPGQVPEGGSISYTTHLSGQIDHSLTILLILYPFWTSFSVFFQKFRLWSYWLFLVRRLFVQSALAEVNEYRGYSFIHVT